MKQPRPRRSPQADKRDGSKDGADRDKIERDRAIGASLGDRPRDVRRQADQPQQQEVERGGHEVDLSELGEYSAMHEPEGAYQPESEQVADERSAGGIHELADATVPSVRQPEVQG